LIPRNFKELEGKEDIVDSSPETVQSKVLFRSSPTSHSSSSTPPSTFSTPPFTAHTPITIIITVVRVVPFPLVVPLIPINMDNRYAPLQLPANPGAMPQDY